MLHVYVHVLHLHHNAFESGRADDYRSHSKRCGNAQNFDAIMKWKDKRPSVRQTVSESQFDMQYAPSTHLQFMSNTHNYCLSRSSPMIDCICIVIIICPNNIINGFRCIHFSVFLFLVFFLQCWMWQRVRHLCKYQPKALESHRKPSMVRHRHFTPKTHARWQKPNAFHGGMWIYWSRTWCSWCVWISANHVAVSYCLPVCVFFLFFFSSRNFSLNFRHFFPRLSYKSQTIFGESITNFRGENYLMSFNEFMRR